MMRARVKAIDTRTMPARRTVQLSHRMNDDSFVTLTTPSSWPEQTSSLETSKEQKPRFLVRNIFAILCSEFDIVQ